MTAATSSLTLTARPETAVRRGPADLVAAHQWNTTRLHSAVGHLPPAEFETAHYAHQSPATPAGVAHESLHQTRGGSDRATEIALTSVVLDRRASGATERRGSSFGRRRVAASDCRSAVCVALAVLVGQSTSRAGS
jgi:hypothetical protein